jgi:hypothetical protein
MPSRDLSFPVFDADNHFYEPREALTKFLPDAYKNVIDYVDVRGRTKIVVRGQISDYIPNPTFEVVARPGAQEEYYRHGNPEGKSYREIMGEPMKSIPAFREPGPRLEVMDELGLDYSLMFPTLASLVEERIKDDPETIHVVIHALNEWMHETWSFNYKDRIFATPVITLPIVDKALEELEWCLERGARTVLVRPAPVPGFRGTRSFGLPEFDPFWKACEDAGIPVSMHASDSGYNDFLNAWEPSNRRRHDRAGLSRCVVAPSQAAGHLGRERRGVGQGSAQVLRQHLRQDAGGLPRGPRRSLQARRLHHAVLGGELRRDRRDDGCRPVRVRL